MTNLRRVHPNEIARSQVYDVIEFLTWLNVNLSLIAEYHNADGEEIYTSPFAIYDLDNQQKSELAQLCLKLIPMCEAKLKDVLDIIPSEF